jgi:type II secretory pathway predicted ATPase ExeA
MYERFFGLRERPFDLVPNPRYLFVSARHREALSNLRLGLTTPRSLTLLIGEAGTGKTTLVETVVAETIRQQIQCVLVSNPLLRREEFIELLARGFGLSDEAARSKSRFLIELREHLVARTDAGLLTALVLDEAQSLPYELLEEVRLLSNIETPTTKMLNVVLAGQPELALRLNNGGLRQLKQRISLRCELMRFDSMETAAYIAGRLRIAGGEPSAIFTREAVLAVHAASRGVPRTINVICDNAMIGGFATQSKPIMRAMIEEVCGDFDLSLAPAAEPVERPSERAPAVSVAAASGNRVAFSTSTPAPARLIAPDPE